MPAPEIKEELEEVKQASAQLETKPYVPAKIKPEAKEDLPDVDKAYEAPKGSQKETAISIVDTGSEKQWNDIKELFARCATDVQSDIETT